MSDPQGQGSSVHCIGKEESQIPYKNELQVTSELEAWSSWFS